MVKATAFTHQQRSQAEDFKSVIAEHAVTENHTPNWDKAKKIEQVSDWRMSSIEEAITIRSTPHNFNPPQGERHILRHVLDSLHSPHPMATEDEDDVAEGVRVAPVTYFQTGCHTLSSSSLILVMTTAELVEIVNVTFNWTCQTYTI